MKSTSGAAGWRLFSALAGCFLLGDPAIAGEPAAEHDIFGLLGITPAEAAVPGPPEFPIMGISPFEPPAASPWTGIPMSATQRAELIAALKAASPEPIPGNTAGFTTLLDLLEEDRRFDEALALIPAEPTIATRHIVVRRVGLLLKAGRRAEAADEASRLAGSPLLSESGPWLALIGVDLALNRHADALETLGFLLDGVPVRPPPTAALIAVQTEIALRAGVFEALDARPAPPAIRALRLRAAGRLREAGELLDGAAGTLTPSDARLLMPGFSHHAALLERVRGLVSDPEVPATDKAAILAACADRSQTVAMFFAMPSGHPEVLPFLPIQLLPEAGLPDFVPACDKLLQAHPDNPWLHLLRARCEGIQGRSTRTHLEAAARAMPANPDPALMAIARLNDQLGSSELDAVITGSPGFKACTPLQKVMRLTSALLDLRVVELLEELSFTDPTHDPVSGHVASHLIERSQSYRMPDGLVATVLGKLPELCAGSPEKSAEAVQRDVAAWFRWLGSQKIQEDQLARAAREVATVIAARSFPGETGVISAIPEYLRSAAGIRAEPKAPSTFAGRPGEIPVWRQALSMFAPPLLVDGDRMAPFGGHPSMMDVPPLRAPSLGLLLSSPWRVSANASVRRTMRRNDAWMLATRLRAVFAENDPRTSVFDALVATSVIPCPDPALRAAAEKRAAAITAARGREADPDLQCYLFLNRILTNNDPEADVGPLPDLTGLPPSTGNRLWFALRRGDQYFSRNKAIIRMIDGLRPQQEGYKAPAPPPLTDQERLTFLSGNGRADTPEALTLAAQVLDSFVDANSTTAPQACRLATSILVSANRFEDYIQRLTARLKDGRKPDLEIQRALFRLHQLPEASRAGGALPFAKRVFELDPADIDAALVVCRDATATNDIATVERCLLSLASHSRRALGLALAAQGLADRSQPLRLFQGAAAADLCRKITSLPPPQDAIVKNQGFTSDNGNLVPLFGLSIRHAPEWLEPLVEWARVRPLLATGTAIDLANQLKKAGHEQKAASFLAGILFYSGKPAADTLRFAPLNRTRITADPPLAALAAEGWLVPLAGIAAETTPDEDNERILLAIQLAAKPDIASWKRLAEPAIAAAPPEHRDELRRWLKDCLDRLPNAGTLVIHLNSEQTTARSSPADLQMIGYSFSKLATSNDAERSTLASMLWKQAVARMDDGNADTNLGFLAQVFTSVARVADDAVWNSYLQRVRATEGFASVWINGQASSIADIDPRRLLEFIPLVLELQPDGRSASPRMTTAFGMLARSGTDTAVLARFRPWIAAASQTQRNPNHASLRFLDLIEGKPGAILPCLVAGRTADGACRFQWSLAGVTTNQSTLPHAGPFDRLDGRFDLTLLAGSDPQRLDRVGTVNTAKTAGSALVSIPDDARHAAILATERDGGVIRWSSPVEIIRDDDWRDLVLEPLRSGGTPVETIAGGGPFGTADAFRFVIPPKGEVIVADIPWNESASQVLELWSLQTPDNGYSRCWSLAVFDEQGKRINTVDLYSDNAPGGLPTWRRFHTKGLQSATANTVRLTLVCKDTDGENRTTVQLAGARILGSAAKPPPPWATRIARIPEAISCFIADPENHRLILFTPARGLGVFNTLTGAIDAWIPIDGGSETINLNSSWISLGGNRVIHADQRGGIRWIDLTTRRVHELTLPEKRKPMPLGSGCCALSRDGRFVACAAGMAGFHLIHIADDGTTSSRTFETGQIHSLRFDPDNSTLIARDDKRQWTLPLANWRDASPDAAAIDHRRQDESPLPESSLNMRGHVSALGLEIETTDNPETQFGFFPASRRLIIPAGIFHAGDRKTLWSISKFGTIHRIDLAPLAGNDPPPAETD